VSAPARPQAAYPTELQQQIDAYLKELSFSDEAGTDGLEEAMSYSLLAGGKRIRPVLALATAQALGRDPADVLPYAAAVELVHTYSLIHDDLPAMDDDDLRRGRPTLHVAYREDIAILAGDGLFAEAMSLVIDRQQGDPAHVMAALGELTHSAGVGGMVGGQYIDVTAAGDLDAAGLRRLHELKTGRLIGASILGVLLLSGLNEPATIPYRRFAAELGVLFQIVDDILDVTGDEEQLGKPQGSDERHGKRTYVSVFGLEKARDLAADSHRKARAALADADGKTETLELITDYILTRPS
jgi:geranylgeranyl diphosphate synthase, type II